MNFKLSRPAVLLLSLGLMLAASDAAFAQPAPIKPASGPAKNPAKSPAKSTIQNAAKSTQPKSEGDNKTVKSETDSKAAPLTAMAGPGKWVPADLSISGHGCSVLIPGDYSLNEFLPPSGKLFCFKGPNHPDKKAAVFNVTIAPSQKGVDIPPERQVMDVMLNPHRKSLIDYKEQKEPIFVNDGHSFKGMSFSGKAKDGKQSSGFVYLTQDKDTYFILFALDEEPFASKSLPLLLKSARGCQIKKQ